MDAIPAIAVIAIGAFLVFGIVAAIIVTAACMLSSRITHGRQ